MMTKKNENNLTENENNLTESFQQAYKHLTVDMERLQKNSYLSSISIEVINVHYPEKVCLLKVHKKLTFSLFMNVLGETQCSGTIAGYFEHVNDDKFKIVHLNCQTFERFKDLVYSNVINTIYTVHDNNLCSSIKKFRKKQSEDDK
jgi:hypothetical protein